MTYDPARIQFELPGDEAWALAQFVKRVGWTEMRENAESEEETYLIRSAPCAPWKTARRRRSRPGHRRAGFFGPYL